MTQTEYEKVKSEFWEQVTNVPKEWFDKMFYRAYTLGKQETKQETKQEKDENYSNSAKIGIDCNITLAERMTVDEHNKIRLLYNNLREGLSLCHEDCVYDALESLEEIFSKDLFNTD